jgi:hypothetical protein
VDNRSLVGPEEDQITWLCVGKGRRKGLGVQKLGNHGIKLPLRGNLQPGKPLRAKPLAISPSASILLRGVAAPPFTIKAFTIPPLVPPP